MADERLPVLHSSRLPWHPVFEEYGVQRTDWQALVEAVFPGAQSLDSIRLALSYCKRRNLDPFKRVIHIVPIWDAEKRKYVDTIWPGIAELRTTAFRTGQYAGADAAQFGEVVESQWEDGTCVVKLIYPAWAQLTVYRLVGGQRVPVPGPRVYWMETYSAKGRSDVPNERWRRAPFQMLEKCAEAAALRRAFPEELGDEHTNEETGAIRDASTPPTPEIAPEASPQTGNEALRSRLRGDAGVQKSEQPAPHPAHDAPDRSPEVQSQSPPAASGSAPSDPGEGNSGERPRKDAVSSPTTPSGGASPAEEDPMKVVKPVRRRGGGWDWSKYADEIIHAARRLRPDQVQEFANKNEQMLSVLRVSDSDEWSRVEEALAEREHSAAGEE